MTLFHLHDDHSRRHAGTTGLSFRRVIKRLHSALRLIHRQVAAAKIHRLRNELMLHADTHADWAKLHGHADGQEADAAHYPRRPAMLGDEWDY